MLVLTPKTDRFGTTRIFRKEGNTFVDLGKVIAFSEPNDTLHEIEKGNYVYTDFYTLAKTHLSQGSYLEVGAIIVGTKDEQELNNLHFAATQSLLQQTRAAKAAQHP